MPHKDPAAAKAAMKARYDAIMADPESAERHRQKHREYYQKDKASGKFDDPAYRARRAEWSRENRDRVRSNLFEAYGGACACCGEANWCFLSLDHKNGDGAAARRALSVNSNGRGRSGHSYYITVRDAGYPDTYQLLCFNCNMAKHIYGACPHQTGARA